MPQGPVRLAELLLGLTAVADLGMGQPVGAATRTCHVAVGIARRLDGDDQTVSDVFHAARSSTSAARPTRTKPR